MQAITRHILGFCNDYFKCFIFFVFRYKTILIPSLDWIQLLLGLITANVTIPINISLILNRVLTNWGFLRLQVVHVNQNNIRRQIFSEKSATHSIPLKESPWHLPSSKLRIIILDGMKNFIFSYLKRACVYYQQISNLLMNSRI